MICRRCLNQEAQPSRDTKKARRGTNNDLYNRNFPYKTIAAQAKKKNMTTVQGVPQSQTVALPRHQEEEETNKRKSNKRTKSIKISSLFHKRGNRNVKTTEKHNNKITQGKT